MSNYSLEEAEKDLYIVENILNVQIEAQAILQILIEKGICTREEILHHRKKVRNLPAYKTSIDDINKSKESNKYYQQNPNEYLKDLFNDKIKGGKKGSD